MQRHLSITLSIIFLFLIFTAVVTAITMSSSNFILRGGNFNQASGKPTNSTFKLGFTSGELGIGLYSGTNYKVRAGFQYLRPEGFRFSISSTVINFGTVNPGEPISRTNTLSITNQSAYGYQVTASENNPLRVLTSGVDIQNTTCDSGTCNDVTSSAWTSPLTYGFGYRCDNLLATDCAVGFSDSTYYKQFSDLSKNQVPQPVMLGSNIGSKQTQITYKLNVSQTQPAGQYQNVIMYIATPAF